ncbi:hypothetical protein TNCV_224571 [Trichonephila clavipes]|nr:hypothetical protein TNCV_224571 [Trichonephila clavipes]
MKSLTYDSPVPSVKGLIARISNCREDTLHVRNIRERKEFHAASLSVQSDDFWSEKKNPEKGLLESAVIFPLSGHYCIQMDSSGPDLGSDRGHELVAGVSWVRTLVPLKTHRVEELMHVKSVEVQSPPLPCPNKGLLSSKACNSDPKMASSNTLHPRSTQGHHGSSSALSPTACRRSGDPEIEH